MRRFVVVATVMGLLAAAGASAAQAVGPVWEKKEANGWKEIAAATPLMVSQHGNFKMIINGKVNSCESKGSGEIEEPFAGAPGLGNLFTNGACKGPTPNLECPGPTKAFQFSTTGSVPTELAYVAAVPYDDLFNPAMVLKCSDPSSTPFQGTYAGSLLEPEVSPIKLKFIGAPSGTLTNGTFSLVLKGVWKVQGNGTFPKIRGK